MLKNNESYGKLSNVAFDGGLNDSQVLLNDPGMVAQDGRLAFLSAFYFYMRPTIRKPSMHDAILGFFTPSGHDLNINICTGCFATTTNILNGSNECRPWSTSQVGVTRAENFLEFSTAFDSDVSHMSISELTCAGQGRFSESSSGASGMPNYITGDWRTNRCQVVTWKQGFEVFSTNDYKRCVCKTWDEDNEHCMDP